MAVEESVSLNIRGAEGELERRKELWDRIFQAYGKGLSDGVKSFLTERVDGLAADFAECIEKLRDKL